MNKYLIISLLASNLSLAQYDYINASAYTGNGSSGECPDGKIAVEIESYDFESDQQGWIRLALIGSFNSWSYIDPNAIPHGGNHSWRARDPSAVADMALISPTIALPLNMAPLTFQFWNKQEIENNDNDANECMDGAILEISTDEGTSFTQFDNEKLLTDPYDGKVATGFNNQIAGSDAWCGDPAEYINSIVDINSYAGESAIFRFRLASDTSVGRPGWDIDDVKIMGCEPETEFIFENGFEESTF